MCVQDVGTLRPEDLPQLRHGFEVFYEVETPGRAMERDVDDPPLGEFGDELSGCRYANRVTSEIADPFQLRKDEIPQAEVDSCQMSNAQEWCLRCS
jgi:hypothetical protein